MNSYLYGVRKASLVLIAWLCLDNDRLCANEWKERFLTEGVARLRELEELTFWLQATIQEENVSQSGKFSSVRECSFQGSWLIDIVKPQWDWDKVHPSRRARIPVEVVRGINSRYEFRIHRSKDRPFQLDAIERVGKGPSDVGPYTFPYARSLSAAWILHLHPFREWLKIDGFSVESVDPIVSSGGNILVKIRAKYDAAERKKSARDPDESFTADVLLDPENHWCIRSVDYIYYNVKGKEGVYNLPKRMSIEYGPHIDGMPVPRLVTEVREYPPESGLAGIVTDKSFISGVQKTGTVSEDQFTLSRFGLPEPPGLEWKRPIRWYLWVGLAGIVCLILGEGFRRFRRRKAGSA